MPPSAWAILGVAAVALGASLVFGWLWWRGRRALREAQAARTAAVDAQHRTAELAVAAERIRIVREMHDVLAHSLAIMIAQADGGSYVTADRAASERAFLTIAETGRAALSDTRRVLGLLRRGEEDADLAPPMDASVDELAERAREAGLEVAVVRLGQPLALPGGSRMALYRICQEALTNVLKHAGHGAHVIITEDWTPERVSVTISNSGGSGGAVPDPLGGHGLGLIGMRERAEIVGGTLRAEPTDEGFTVRAVLPVTADEGDT